jgi:hypothetical protein
MEYELVKYFDNTTANYRYTLYQKQDNVVVRSWSGDESWAKRAAKHYKLELPEYESARTFNKSIFNYDYEDIYAWFRGKRLTLEQYKDMRQILEIDTMHISSEEKNALQAPPKTD